MTNGNPYGMNTRAVELINEAEGLIEGYVHIWNQPGTKDAYGTWFDRENPPEMALDFAPFPLHYEHAMDGRIRKDIVGKIDRVWFDNVGVRFSARLYRDKPYFGKLIADVRNGKLKTSSATAPHLADFDEDGRFVHWELSEVSLTETPAEASIPAVELIRAEQGRDASGAANERNTLSTSDNHQENMMEPNEQVQEEEQTQRADLGAVLAQLMQEGYTLDEIMAALQQMQQPSAMSAAPAEAPRSADSTIKALQALLSQRRQQSEVEQLRAENERLKAARNAPPAEQPEARPANNPSVRNVQVSEEGPLRRLSHSEMLFAHQAMRGARIQPSDTFLRTMKMRVVKLVESDKGVFADPSVRSVMPFTRANEIMTSTASGGGDEWVAVAYSSELWEKARENRIYQDLVSRGMRVEEVPQGHESIVIFTESTDPTVYTLTQSVSLHTDNRPAVNVATTRPGTGNATLTPGQLGLAAAYSDVFEEDSLIAAAPQLNRQINEKMEETIEQLMINGDTETGANTNINLIDSTPGTGLSTPYYIASNGFLKYALVTGSSTSRDGGALDENDFRLTHKLLPSAIRSRRDRLVFIIDPDTHNAALDIPAIKTEDVKRTNATIEAGVLSRIWGVDVMESGFMALANTAGKISNTGSNNTKGRILEIYAPYWAMGWKRRVAIETDKDILSGTNIIVAKMRVGFLARGAGAAVVSYNLTV